MANRREELDQEMRSLVNRGLKLWFMEYTKELDELQRNDIRSEFLERLAPASEDDETDPDSVFDVLVNDFGAQYQQWFTHGMRVVEQLAPDRYEEFCNLYRQDRRKDVDIYSYGVDDYIAGITPLRASVPRFDIRSVAMGRFKRQIDIISSIETRIHSALSNIAGTLEADLFDSELEAARSLSKAGHFRGAGVVAGVVLEGHLQRLVADHKVTFRKTKTLANLNQALKDALVYDTAEWRKIGYLTDIRNECGHKTGTEPTALRVAELIDGVDRVIKTVA